MTSLSGLGNLTSIGGGLNIGARFGAGDSGYQVEQFYAGNPVLTSLSGLGNLNSIAGVLSVIDNDALTSLSGLDNLIATSIEGLIIYNNAALSTCEVQSICDFLEASPDATVEISGNYTGCNSIAQVEFACIKGVENNPSLNVFQIFIPIRLLIISPSNHYQFLFNAA